MNLEIASQLASIVASLAVVISLIFIGLQLRQNAHLTRMAAAQTSAQMLSENFGRVIDSADLADLLVRTRGKDDWSPAEYLRVSNFLSASFRHHEVLHIHRRYGIFEEELWQGARARLKEQLSNPGIRNWFTETSPFYAKSFVEHVNKICKELDAEGA